MTTIRLALDRNLNGDDRALASLDLATGAWADLADAPPAGPSHGESLSPAPAGTGWAWPKSERIPDQPTGAGSTIIIRDDTGTPLWQHTFPFTTNHPAASTWTPHGWVQVALLTTAWGRTTAKPDPDTAGLLRITPDGTITLTQTELPDPHAHDYVWWANYPSIDHHGTTIASALTTYRNSNWTGTPHTYGISLFTTDATTVAPVARTTPVPYTTSANPSAPTVAVLPDDTILLAWIDYNTDTTHLHHYTRILDLIATTTLPATGAIAADSNVSLITHGADTLLLEQWSRTYRAITTSPLAAAAPAPTGLDWIGGRQVSAVHHMPDGTTLATTMDGDGSCLITITPDGTWGVHHHPDWWNITGVYLDRARPGLLSVDTLDHEWWVVGTRDPGMPYELCIDTPLGWMVEIVAGEEPSATHELVIYDPTHEQAGPDGWVVCALMRPDTQEEGPGGASSRRS